MEENFMQKYIILTDSTTDLPASYATENNLEVVPLGFTIDGVNYRNYLDNRELSSADFYNKIAEGKQGKYAVIKKWFLNNYKEAYEKEIENLKLESELAELEEELKEVA